MEKNSTCIIESLCCTPEPLTTLLSTIFQYRKKRFFKKVHTVKSFPPVTWILLSYRGSGNYQFGAQCSMGMEAIRSHWPRSLLDFSYTLDGETRMNFLASPMCSLPPLHFCVFYFRNFKRGL